MWGAYPWRTQSAEGPVGQAKVVKARLHKNKINVLYCYSHVCHLAASAAVLLASKGYPVMELEGGWRWWQSNGFEIEK
jgi:rhodanese-related sulfurtransferase